MSNNYAPTGNCDICKEKPAKYWFNATSAATCGDYSCSEAMEDRWIAHCEDMERERELEEQMREQYGSYY